LTAMNALTSRRFSYSPVFWLFLLYAGVSYSADSTDAPQMPAPTGPYGVARVSYDMVDRTRQETLGEKPGSPREVMVEVWYPTAPRLSSPQSTAPYLPGFDAAKPRLSQDDISDLFRPARYMGTLPKTHTVENAPIAPGKDKFPLLLFSHGWGNPTFLYTAELEDIVSHGYVVAAVDHPYDTTFTQFPDGHIVFFAQEAFNAATKKPNGYIAYARERVEVMARDNRFVLTQVLQYASEKNRHAPFFHRIDASRIGALGHSIGGLAAARTCQIDDRVEACIDQDSDDNRGSPFIVTDISETERQPFLLFVVASADETSPRHTHPDDATLAKMKMSRADYDAMVKQHQANQLAQLKSIPGGAYRVTLYNLPGFIHRSFTDQTLIGVSPDPAQSVHNFRVAQTYTLAFFDKYLKGDRRTVIDTGEVVDSRAIVESFNRH
jgi:predicted dienelactone hydrolase